MQAITTHYVGPTDTKGSRIVASCQAGKVTLEYDCALNRDTNHELAAVALMRKFSWFGVWARGYMPNNNPVWVFVSDNPDCHSTRIVISSPSNVTRVY